MQNLVTKIEKYLDTLSQRDQISLAVILFVVILMLWISMIYTPLSNNMATLKRDLAQNDTNMVIAQAKLSALQQSILADPDSENRELLARYIEDNKNLDLELAKTTTQIMNPQEMVQLLKQMLESQSGLKFVSLKNKPSVPEFIESRNQDEVTSDSVSSIYRHSVVLEVEGSYHSALSYMKKLEKLPWRFFWQGVEIETKKYPNTVITLEVYTLGFREGLIGA